MQAIILAAGLGTRMRPLTDTTPKPMLKIGGMPILERTVASLPSAVTEVIFVVGYLQEQIRAHFGEFYGGRSIKYVEQKELLGSAHAVHQCSQLITDRFLVLNGDDLYDAEDVASTASHRLAVLGMPVEDGGRFGAVVKDDAGNLARIAPDGSITGPSTVNIGVYSLDKRFFSYPMVPVKVDSKEFGLPHTIAGMVRDHVVSVVEAKFWMPIGYPADLERAETALAERAKAPAQSTPA